MSLIAADPWPAADSLETAIIGQQPYWYTMYGRHFKSDFPLPVRPSAPPASGIADCVFGRAPLNQVLPQPDVEPVAGLSCPEPCHNGRMVTLVHRSARGSWFWQESVGTCFVHPDSRRVDVYVEPDYDAGSLGLMLLGQVATLVLHKQGFPSLHASAVVVDGRGVAFVGLPGRGKSTMAGNFLQRGATLLTDDVLPLYTRGGTVMGIPSLPMMKVWSQTVEHTLELQEQLPDLSRSLPKKLLTTEDRYPFASEPVPIGGVYLVTRYDPALAGRADVDIDYLGRRDGLKFLITNMLNRAYLLASENAAIVPLFSALTAQAKMGLISLPNGFDRQEAVYSEIYARITADLRGNA